MIPDRGSFIKNRIAYRRSAMKNIIVMIIASPNTNPFPLPVVYCLFDTLHIAHLTPFLL